MMTFGSLFDGISCFTLGLSRAGLEPRWLVEIEADCRRVSAQNFPGVKQFSDVKDCGSHNLEPVDLICFGSPCQDFSVAGKREGIKGKRSGLFYEAIRICRELQPHFALFENVPGLLSSHAGRDFAAVLSAFRECGARDICWRICDSRYWGVAQRRRRVFLVADFRGDLAAQVLVESGCGGRNPAAGEETGKDLASTIRSRSSRSGVNPPGRGGEDDRNLVCNALDAHMGMAGPDDNAAPARHLVAGTLNAHSKRHGHAMGTQQAAESGHLVSFSANGSGSERAGPPSLAASDDNGTNHLVTRTLRSEEADASEDGTGRGVPITAFYPTGGTHGVDASDDISPPLKVGSGVGIPSSPAVAYTVSSAESCEVHSHARETETARCLDQTGGFANGQGGTVVAFQCHGSNVGPMGTIRQGNGGLTGGVPFVAQEDTPLHVVVLDTQTNRIAEDSRFNWFWWTQGNGSCDCNRELMFEPYTERGTCIGCKRYIVIRVNGELPDADWNNGYPAELIGKPVAFADLGEGHIDYQPTDVACPIRTGGGGGEKLATIVTGHAEPVSAWKESQSGCREGSVHATLDANKGSRRQEGVVSGTMVRRLMPVECLRLMGLPDDWLDVEPPLSDSAKYRMIGNGGVVNVLEWIGRRILAALEAQHANP